MLVIEPATPTLRFSSRNVDLIPRRLSQSAAVFASRSQCRKLAGKSCARSCSRSGYGIRASAIEQPGSGSFKQNAKPQRYHPFEDISDSELDEDGKSRLTPAETTRNIIEVNSKATLMFSGLVSDEVHENIFWPDLPYVTDEHGDIYFRVKNDQDILQTLSGGENLVQVIIGLDAAEMLREMEDIGTELDFAVDELDNEDSYLEDDSDEDDDDEDDEDDEDDGNYGEDWVAIVDNGEDEDEDSDGSLGDWAKLDTMRSSHPMYFAKKIAEAASDDPIDFMDQPPAGLAIQGLVRPAFVEEHVWKHLSDNHSTSYDTIQTSNTEGHKEEDIFHINGYKHEKESAKDASSSAEDLEKDETQEDGTSFYKLEMAKIQLISSQGHQSFVEIEDCRRARPDAIAHSAANIIGRVRAGGEKTTQALKSLCWRCKGIQVEEVTLIGVDSLGFDLRVCSGTQVQTLRFAFSKRATSEYSAEQQLNYLLFPRINKQLQQKKEPHQSES